MSGRGDEAARAEVQYSGDVQGVGFRMTALRQAAGAKVAGWVRNEPDGSVRLEVEGSRPDVERYLQRVRSALEMHIDDEQIDWKPPTGATDGFRIRD